MWCGVMWSDVWCDVSVVSRRPSEEEEGCVLNGVNKVQRSRALTPKFAIRIWHSTLVALMAAA